MRRSVPGPVVVCVSAAFAGGALAQLPGRVLAQSGDPFPALPGGVFGGLSPRDPAQGWKDHVILNALNGMQGPAVIAGPFGDLRVVAASGLANPAVPGATFGFSALLVTGAGGANSAAFDCSLVGIPQTPRSLMQGPTTLREVLRANQTIPGDLRINTWARPAVANDSDATAVLVSLGGTGVNTTNDTGIWLDDGLGAASLIVREGGPAPELAGRVVGIFSPSSVPVNNLGQAAAMALTSGGGGAGSAIFRFSAQGSRVVAYAGMPAPGVGTNQVFSSFVNTSPALDNTGRVMFQGTVTGQLPPGQGPNGIWHGPPGVLTLLARTGWPAPDAEAGVTLQLQGDGALRPACNDVGEIAFVSQLSGPGVTGANNRAIFAGSATKIRMLCRTGQTLPGFANLPIQFIEGPININNLGQVAFLVTAGGVRSVVAYDPVIGLRTALRLSAPFQTDRGSRTYSAVFVDVQSQNVQARYLTDAGSMFIAGGMPSGGTMAVEFKVRFPADLNGDGTLDANDYLAFLNAYRAHARLADLNFDEAVDFNDYLEFLAQFNQPTW